MERFVATFVAIFAAIFVAIAMMFSAVLSGKPWRAVQDSARARHIKNAEMNARLLRFNI